MDELPYRSAKEVKERKDSKNQIERLILFFISLKIGYSHSCIEFFLFIKNHHLILWLPLNLVHAFGHSIKLLVGDSPVEYTTKPASIYSVQLPKRSMSMQRYTTY